MTTDDLLGKVYEMDLYLGNTVSGFAVFTVQEVRPDRNEVVAVDNHTLDRQTFELSLLVEAIQNGRVQESALAPYARLR